MHNCFFIHNSLGSSKTPNACRYASSPLLSKERGRRGEVFRIALACTISFLLISCFHDKNVSQGQHSYHRIISFAPSITETLFALSIGNSVIGVTDFCNFPPEAKKLPKVGGYTNPNYEIILRLKPDLVVLLKENSSLFGFLQNNNIEYLCFDNQNISQILSSFKIIGQKCDREKQADSLIKLIKNEMVRDTINPPWPKTLICVDRENRGNGKIARIYCASKKSFYNELLNAACMENVLKDFAITYPEISSEGIIRMQPEIIIDFAMREQEIPEDRFKSDWKSMPMLPAVKNNMIFCISNDYATIPGPRILATLKDFKKINAAYRGIK
jgi:iron complex transport system substrate-binding protein